MAYLTVQKIVEDLKQKTVVPPPQEARVSYERLGAHFIESLTAHGYEVTADRQNNTIALTLGEERMLLGRGTLRNKGSLLPLTGVKRGTSPVTLEDFWSQISPGLQIENFARLPISVMKVAAPVVEAKALDGNDPYPDLTASIARSRAEDPSRPAVPQAGPSVPVDAPPTPTAATPAEAPAPADTPVPPPPFQDVAPPATPASAVPAADVPAPTEARLPDEPFPTHHSVEPTLDDIGRAKPVAPASEAPKAPAPRAAAPSTLGVLVDHGFAPYQNKPENSRSYYATIQTKDGNRTIWGADLERAIAVNNLKNGDRVEATNQGSREVDVMVSRGGGPAEKVVVKRNVWSVELREVAKPSVAPSAPPMASPAPPASDPLRFKTRWTDLPPDMKAPNVGPTAPVLAADEAEYVKENVRAVLSLSCFADAKFDALKKASALDPCKWARHPSVRGGQLTSPSIDGVSLSATTLLAINILMWPPDQQRSAAAALARVSKDPLVGDSPAETVDNAVWHLLAVPPTADTVVALLFLADKPASFKHLLERQRVLGGSMAVGSVAVEPPLTKGAFLRHSEYLEKLTLGNLNFTAPNAIEALNDVQPDALQWEALKRRPDIAGYSGLNTPGSKPHVERLRSLAVLAKALPKTAALADVQGALLPTLATAATESWEPFRLTFSDRIEKDREIIRAAEAGMARIAANAKVVPVAYGKNAAAFTEAARVPLLTRFANLFRRNREVSCEAAPGYTTLRLTNEQYARIKPILDAKVDCAPTPTHTDVNLGPLARNVPEALEMREAAVKSVEDRLNQRQRNELLPPGMNI